MKLICLAVLINVMEIYHWHQMDDIKKKIYNNAAF